MPAGHTLANMPGVVTGAGREPSHRVPERNRGGRDEIDDASVERHRRETGEGATRDRDAFRRRDPLDLLRKPAFDPGGCVVGVAQIDRHHCASGDDIDEVRMQRHRADGTDLRATEREHQRRAPYAAIATPAYPASWRSAIGVVPAWFDCPTIVRALRRDALDALDRADAWPVRLEDRTLLDVQLDETRAARRPGTDGVRRTHPGESSPTRAPSIPTTSSAPSTAMPPAYTRLPIMSGANARLSSFVKKSDAERAAGDDVAPAQASRSTRARRAPRDCRRSDRRYGLCRCGSR